MAAHLQELAKRQAHKKRKGNPQRGVNESAAARFQNFVEIHAEAEGHDRTLEKCARNAAAFVDVRMREAETEENSQSESDRRRKQSRERKCESENKNNFRESRHRLGKEYQAGSRMGQQEREWTLKRCCPPPFAKSRRASFFFLFCRRSDWLVLRGRGMSEGGDDFAGGSLADLAVAVVDAALREGVLAAAGAGFGVEFVERDDFLLGRELGEIDAGKFTSAFGVLQKNLAGVVEGFHFDVADGQAEERTDFGFVKKWVAEAFVFLNDAAFRVEHERRG